MTKEILIAGFGGQGILFSGKLLVYAAMKEGMEVSWLPSYGPAMRGGTANCSIVISDKKIGSPIVTKPDILVAMNRPSFDKYVNEIKEGGICFVDSSLVDAEVKRKDIETYRIPSTEIAQTEELLGFANIVMVGYLVKCAELFGTNKALENLKYLVGDKKKELLEYNIKAFNLGVNYKA